MRAQCVSRHGCSRPPCRKSHLGLCWKFPRGFSQVWWAGGMGILYVLPSLSVNLQGTRSHIGQRSCCFEGRKESIHPSQSEVSVSFLPLPPREHVVPRSPVQRTGLISLRSVFYQPPCGSLSTQDLVFYGTFLS